ncbi:MAG: hypothetical protein JO261_15705 [Alphaproteobacteria bacterium]|nr:hypothetical protein [Alphaproteobacteria bacterium]MBV9695138.1 hypothetical protein [Alphaproteobacteria bacterium]
MGLARIAARSAATLIFVLLCGCATQLAPSYSQSIVDGLNAANTQTLTLFATLSSGVTADTFVAQRQATYNGLIGQFSALESQVSARPMPQPLWTGSLPDSQTLAEWKKVLESAPTKGSLETIVSVLTKMRDEDQKSGFKAVTVGCSSATLDPALICGFQNAYTQNFDSALTYEMALKR